MRDKRHTRMAVFSLLMILLVSCALDDNEIYFPLENGVTWTNHRDTGITSTNPTVIKDNGVFKMWTYTNASDEIHYQESSDGINWSSPVVVLTLGNEPYGVDGIIHPWVIKDGPLYKMWYSAATGGWAAIDIIYCESNDGINWTNFQMVMDSSLEQIPGITSPWYTTPCVIKVDGRYRIWFIGENYLGADIIYAESDNGVKWSNFTKALYKNSLGPYDENSALKPCVIRDNTGYKIWYAGFNRLSVQSAIYAESKNGVIWQNFKLSMDYFNIITAVINDGGIGKAWYNKYDDKTGNFLSIWYAESK